MLRAFRIALQIYVIPTKTIIKNGLNEIKDLLKSIMQAWVILTHFSDERMSLRFRYCFKFYMWEEKKMI